MAPDDALVATGIEMLAKLQNFLDAYREKMLKKGEEQYRYYAIGIHYIGDRAELVVHDFDSAERAEAFAVNFKITNGILIHGKTISLVRRRAMTSIGETDPVMFSGVAQEIVDRYRNAMRLLLHELVLLAPRKSRVARGIRYALTEIVPRIGLLEDNEGETEKADYQVALDKVLDAINTETFVCIFEAIEDYEASHVDLQVVKSAINILTSKS